MALISLFPHPLFFTCYPVYKNVSVPLSGCTTVRRLDHAPSGLLKDDTLQFRPFFFLNIEFLSYYHLFLLCTSRARYTLSSKPELS